MRVRSCAPWCSLATIVVAALLVLSGCGSDAPKAEPRASRPQTVDDLVMQAGDFVNLHDMTPVRGFFVANPLGHLNETLAVANSTSGGTYPVGTVLQLIPTEVMVKRRAGFDPATKDWEFFALEVDATGSKIADRGSTEVVNQFGLQCFACHVKADERFDLVCEKDHGCDPLPIGDDVIHSVQEADPRPRAKSR